MRVCVVVPGYSLDEQDWCIPVLRTYIDRLSSRIDVLVVTPHYPYSNSTYRIGNVTVHCLSDRKRTGIPRLLLWRKTIRTIVDEGRRSPFSAIHGFWGTETGYLATIAARRLRSRSIVSLAGGEMAALPDFDYGAKLRLPGRVLVARSLARADVVTAGSSWMIDLLPERHRRHAVRLPLGVDIRLFTPMKPRTGRRLLAVSSLYPWKDLPTTIRAVAMLVDDFPDVTLDIAGVGILHDKLVALARDLGIGDRVQFHGEVRHERMPDLYRNTDLLVHAGRYEAQGMAILEALATGMPVIASRVGIAADLDGDLVRTFEPGDVERLVQILRQSFRDAGIARRIAVEGPRRVAAEYSVEHTLDQFLRIYHGSP